MPKSTTESTMHMEQGDKTNSDLETTRVVRGSNLFDIYGINNEGQETTLDKLETLAGVERYLEIRQHLFPAETFGTLDGYANPRQLISRKVEGYSNWYPEINTVAKELLPAYCKFLDSCESLIDNLPENEKEDAGIRLASTAFVFGTMIHPSSNGNGQTFKTLALSYIHQFCPSYKNKYFPIKYSELMWSQANDITTSFSGFKKFDAEKIVPKDNKTKVIIELLDKLIEIEKMRNLIADEEFNLAMYKIDKLEFEAIKEIAEKEHLPELLHMQEAKVRTMHIETKDTESSFSKGLGEPIPEGVLHTYKANATNILKDLGYNQREIRKTIYGVNVTFERVEEMTNVLINENAPLLVGFVLTGNIAETQDKRISTIAQEAVTILDEVKQEMKDILNNDDISSLTAMENDYKNCIRYDKIAHKIKIHSELNSLEYTRKIEEFMGQADNMTPSEKLEWLEREFN